jgi:hypothetical protein
MFQYIFSYCIDLYRFVSITSKAVQMGQTSSLSQKPKMKVIYGCQLSLSLMGTPPVFQKSFGYLDGASFGLSYAITYLYIYTLGL